MFLVREGMVHKLAFDFPNIVAINLTTTITTTIKLGQERNWKRAATGKQTDAAMLLDFCFGHVVFAVSVAVVSFVCYGGLRLATHGSGFLVFIRILYSLVRKKENRQRD